MPQLLRRSLLLQLVSVYLVFVLVVLAAGLSVNAIIEQRLRNDVQAADLALAQDIALDTSTKLTSAEQSLVMLGAQARAAGDPADMVGIFQAFMAARNDIDHIYWVDSLGIIRLSISSPTGTPDVEGVGAQFTPPDVVEQAYTAPGPVYEIGIVAETAVTEGGHVATPTVIPTPGVIIATPVRDNSGHLIGILATSLSLSELSAAVTSVVQAQRFLHRDLSITIVDDQGVEIASPDSTKLLDYMLNVLPGADQALQGKNTTREGLGADGSMQLFSSVPVKNTGWAVVVQRPSSQALAVVGEFHLWLLIAALIFALGGLVFWWMLLRRVIRPLQTLAHEHETVRAAKRDERTQLRALHRRPDEMGDLARSLDRLERDVHAQLGELRTLLATSTAVVGSLDPQAVVGTIIREAGRLVDIQAAAVLVPDEQGVLRVLVSEGHSDRYHEALSLSPENMTSAAVAALRDGCPVQKLLDPSQVPISLSTTEGFRVVLAIPIISRHAGGVVLLVHRREPQLFSENEVDLLLTFANYATLAWEHAKLYERSDERLREVALENERLYREASAERQRLAAITGSLRDGLVLTSVDGTVLYANPGASALVGEARLPLERHPISTLYAALTAAAADREACARALGQLATGAATDETIELGADGSERRVFHLRLFDVSDESGGAIGRGLLLRDITREHEVDEFKTTLLGAVGHELRTPLTVIKGHASTLLQDDVAWSEADQRHFLQTISDEADRLAQLVRNLLDLSRQEAGLLLLNRAPTALEDVIARTVARARQPGVTLTLDVPDPLPTIEVDRARLEVVLDNLLANAVTYGEGEVRVRAEATSSQVVIAVTDNGPGLAPDELPHAFERFYRARRGREQRSGGTGLGLAICRAFVEAHGGTIWAERQEDHTTFALTLPRTTTLRTVGTRTGAGERVAAATTGESLERSQAS